MINKFKYGSYGYIAVLDINDAEDLANIKPRIAVQYLQQAVEKILKHYLTLIYTSDDKDDVIRSHKSTLLSKKSGLIELKKYYGTMALLSQYYFDNRYPGIDYEEPTSEDVNSFLKDVSEIFKIVISAIDGYEPSKSFIEIPKEVPLTKINLKEK